MLLERRSALKITLAFATLFCVVLHAKTLQNQDFFGPWSTSQGNYPARQQLTLFDQGGTWTGLDDNGVKLTLQLSPKDIKYINDFVIVTIDKGNEQLTKLVFSGWQTPRSRRIFGTEYLYERSDGNTTLIDGRPFAMNEGTDYVVPQIIWTSGYIHTHSINTEQEFNTLVQQLSALKGASFSKDSDIVAISFEQYGVNYIFTQASHPAHPGVLILNAAHYKNDWKLHGLHTGDKQAFEAWRTEMERGLRDYAAEYQQIFNQRVNKYSELNP